MSISRLQSYDSSQRETTCVAVIVRLWGQTACLYTECTCWCLRSLTLRFKIFHLLQFYHLAFTFAFFLNAPSCCCMAGGKKTCSRWWVTFCLTTAAPQLLFHWLDGLRRTTWLVRLNGVRWVVACDWITEAQMLGDFDGDGWAVACQPQTRD